MEQEQLTIFREWFAGYCSGFYGESPNDDSNYRLKEEHTHQVCARMRQLVLGEGLGEQEGFLAEAIALFHDVGRFEQYRRFKTFKDSDSINHASLGVQVLKEHCVLDVLDEMERNSINLAVGLHNAFRVPSNLSTGELRLVNLVRDADKLDIWRVFAEQFALPSEMRPSALSLGIPESADYSPEALASVRGGEMVRLATVKSLNDFKLLQLSWLYDLNFPTSYKVAAEEDYVGRLGAMLPVTADTAALLDQLRVYVQKRQSGTCSN
jgi:hypothetical protein